MQRQQRKAQEEHRQQQQEQTQRQHEPEQQKRTIYPVIEGVRSSQTRAMF